MRLGITSTAVSLPAVWLGTLFPALHSLIVLYVPRLVCLVLSFYSGA
jgi:hypothetical protein